MFTFKIKHKFILIASIGVIAVVFMMYLAQSVSKESFHTINEIFHNAQKTQKIEESLIVPLFNLRELSLSLVMSPNEKYRLPIRQDLLFLVKKLNNNFEKLDKDIQNEWAKYKKLVILTNKYIIDDFEEGAYTNANTAERKQFYILMRKLNTIQKAQITKSYKVFEKIKTKFIQTEQFIFLISLIILLLSFIFYFAIVHNIVLSINTLQNGLKKFFDLLGRKIQTHEDININLKNKDEFYEMAHMINQNVQNVKVRLLKDIELIKNATNVVNELKIGHLDRRFELNEENDELNKLKVVLNQMLDNLQNRINEEIKQKLSKEQLLIQQSKLATMGEMIGNIAHQWRQPLGEIGAILMRLQVKKEHDDLNDGIFDQSLEECEILLTHMSNTISDFQNFFKPSKEKTIFSLKKACSNASFIISSSLKFNHINLSMNIQQEARVYGYPREFSQAILNLLSNAKDILIERNIKNPFINLTIKKGKKFAIISVEDNAGGVDERYIDRIFEPYFTTKHAKQGTGIGLYMCKTIIEGNMQGYIKVVNTSNGALFTVKLAL